MNIAIVDLLTQTPYYDLYLSREIAPLVDDLTLYAIDWHREPGYLESPSFNRSPGLVDLIGKLGIRKQRPRQLAKFGEYLMNWVHLLVKFRREPPDVVHIQWLPMLERSRVQLWFVHHLQKLGIPVIYTVHNFAPHDVEAGSVYKELYLSADHLIVHTFQDADRLHQEIGVAKHRVTVIPQGAVFAEQIGIDQKHARSQLGIDKDATVFLMMGVIRPYKGLDIALRALEDVVTLHADCRLFIVGNPLDSSYLAQLQNLSSTLKLEGFIDWHIGYVPSKHVGLFHAAADVAMFPYRAISQSAAFLTAAALGKCVLASNVGGIGEVVRDGKTGLLIDSAESAELAAGMCRAVALGAAGREALGNALREQVLHDFSWDHTAAQTVQVYRSLAAENTL